MECIEWKEKIELRDWENYANNI